MKTKQFRSFYFLFAVVAISVSFFGCKKDFGDKISLNASTKDGPVPSYYFDWVTQTFMPSSLSSDQVQMPWNSGTTPIDINLASDYSHQDGWVMVWNSFSPTQPISGSQNTMFFALYNVYRGLLRFYLYQPPSTVATTNVSHGLNLYNSSLTSSMLNFNAQTIINTSTNQTSFAEVQNRQFNANGGTWYVFQYEIAYDPNIANTYFIDPSIALSSTQALEWKSQWTNITSATFNAQTIGTISGNIGEPQSALATIFNTLGNAAAVAIQVYGLNNLPGGLTGANAASYQNAISGALGGSINNIFNGIVSSPYFRASVN